MTPEKTIGLLAEPARLRIFSAIVLGASTPSEAVRASGVSARDAAIALRRLQDGELVVDGEDGLRARGEQFKAMAREAAPGPEAASGAGATADGTAGATADGQVGHGHRDERVESLLRTFVRGDRLLGAPAQFGRRRTVLRHLAERAFEPGAVYAEREVNEILRAWCEGGRTDHVSVRRYLIDHCILTREDGRYRLRDDA